MTNRAGVNGIMRIILLAAFILILTATLASLL